ncbi:hypothetical protein REPUB_Repub05bG0104000 [Reevesia pubescens]
MVGRMAEAVVQDQVLRTRRTLSVLGSEVYKGLCDIAFMSTDDSRLIASDTHGAVNIWDRRKSPLPCLELITGSHSTLNSIQPHVENQVNKLKTSLVFIMKFTYLNL